MRRGPGITVAHEESRAGLVFSFDLVINASLRAVGLRLRESHATGVGVPSLRRVTETIALLLGGFAVVTTGAPIR